MTDQPFNPVASEQAVVGSVLISEGEALDQLTLTPEDFVSGSLSAIYAATLELHGAGRPVDQFTVVDALPARYHQDVYDAAGAVFAWHNVGFYADIVASASLRRRLAQAGDALKDLAAKGEDATLGDLARTTLDGFLGVPQGDSIPTMRERMDEYLRRMAEPVVATPTPWHRLNAQLGGGLRPSGFYVIGARPGIGKSAIALQLAHSLSGTAPVLFCSLEMPEQEVALRVMAQQNRIPFRALLNNNLTDFMRDRLTAWRGTNPLNIAIDDSTGLSVFDIRNRARTMHRKTPLGGVVVDYLQLMTDPRDLPRWEKVAEMTRNLKLLSRELGVPVIACSQLNRESTRRADSKPSLSDLRESGSIEQDADVVILLDREEDSTDLALILAKNRQGDTGTVLVNWQGEFVRAVDSSVA